MKFAVIAAGDGAAAIPIAARFVFMRQKGAGVTNHKILNYRCDFRSAFQAGRRI